jgi:zinc transporter ZupT
MFFYIAIKDFYPQIILKNNIKENTLQAVFVLFGLMFVIVLDFLLGSSY